jgi:hypothetical protein
MASVASFLQIYYTPYAPTAVGDEPRPEEMKPSCTACLLVPDEDKAVGEARSATTVDDLGQLSRVHLIPARRRFSGGLVPVDVGDGQAEVLDADHHGGLYQLSVYGIVHSSPTRFYPRSQFQPGW